MTRAARLGLLVALVAGSLGGCSIDERTLTAAPASLGGQGGDGGAAGDGNPTTEGGGGDDNPTTEGGGDAGASAGDGGAAGKGASSGSSGQSGGGQGPGVSDGGQGGGAGQGGAGGMSGSSGQGGQGPGGAGSAGEAGAGGSGGQGCDQACIDSCKEKYPGGSDELDSLYGCIVVNCSGPCNTSPQACQSCQTTKCGAKFQACEANGACESILQCINGTSECGICQQQSCKSELQNCPDGSECIALYDCIVTEKMCASGDQACLNECATEHPTGVTPLNALSNCIEQKCDAPCSSG